MVLPLLFLMACGGTKNTTSVMTPPTADVYELTYQDMFPGVLSNLRKTRNYNAVFTGTFPEPTELKAFLVDSIRLPVSTLALDSEDKRQPFVGIQGEYKAVRIVASRQYYQDAPKVVQETTHELSGRVLEGKQVLLEVVVNGETLVIDLGEASKKDPLYAP